ncbi:MAG: ParA family protein [Chloroflexaceae bacterium]|nr:ParA family protein [Chloroflexaceae bacterium]
MTVLALTMQKGGVGKTTTTLGVGTELAQAGLRVLLIDLDPQSNLTMALGINPEELQHSVYEVLLNPTAGADFAIVPTAYGPDLIPATLELAGAELTLAGRFGRELLLRTALTETRYNYDFVLIDSPPSLGLFTVNAMVAADEILVPLQAHVFARKAMPQLESTIALVRQSNPLLQIGGIVVTMVDRRTSVNQLIEESIRETYGDLVYATVIPFNVRLVEAPAAGQPISRYAPDSAGARAYRDLTQELLQRYGIKQTTTQGTD